MAIETWTHENGFTWNHVELNEEGEAWLQAQGLDRLVMAALTAADTRPRITPFGTGAVVVLRGVNLNAGADPEDMISARIWLENGRAISVWRRPLRAMRILREAADAGQGPAGSGELVTRLALGLSDTAGPVITELAEKIDLLEEAMTDPERDPDQDELSDMRRVLIVLKRFFAPQHAALKDMGHIEAPWLLKRDRQRLHEAADRFARLTEELESLTQRAHVMQDHLTARRADAMNQQMFVLSVVAALFLPLGFLTGLLGINVGGMPGVDDPRAFWFVCVLLLVIGLGQWWLFRALGIIGRGRP